MTIFRSSSGPPQLAASFISTGRADVGFWHGADIRGWPEQVRSARYFRHPLAQQLLVRRLPRFRDSGLYSRSFYGRAEAGQQVGCLFGDVADANK